MSRLVIDTDPGVDDALAIALVLRSPEFDLVGVTTVFGNVGTATATRNALALLDAFGRADVPVARGAEGPLVGIHGGPVPHIHGHDGLGDGDAVPPTTRAPLPDVDAARFLVDALTAAPGEVTILALGPLTNLALALRREPAIAGLARRVVLMGGNAAVPGNATPAAEANILGDPEAADLVLGAGWPVTAVGLDVTQRAVLDGGGIARLAGAADPVGRLVRGAVPLYRRFYREVNGIDGICLHDPSAAAFLLAPALFTTRALPVRVETESFSRGKTWPDFKASDRPAPAAWAGRPAVDVCLDADLPALVDLVVTRLLS